jgi:hypothetical protein
MVVEKVRKMKTVTIEIIKLKTMWTTRGLICGDILVLNWVEKIPVYYTYFGMIDSSQSSTSYDKNDYYYIIVNAEGNVPTVVGAFNQGFLM